MKDAELEKVERQLARMRSRRDVRWTMSSETAEQAISALLPHARPTTRKSGKTRLRKRTKRLL